MAIVTVGKKSIVVLLIHEPPKKDNDPEKIYNDINEGTIRIVHEVVEHTYWRW